MSNEQRPEGAIGDFVNAWKPVTDAYQDTDAPPVDQPITPPPAVIKPVAQVKKRKVDKVPIAITCLGWFYMIRAAVFLICARVVSSNPDSGLAVVLTQHATLLVPFRMHPASGEIPVGLFVEGLVITAILSVVVGGMWLARWWKIRWITMFYAGASAARTVIYLAMGTAGGFGGAITEDQKQAMLASCAVNILIFCYLAFYPGVEQAFEDKL
jgi:hypothetical protein